MSEFPFKSTGKFYYDPPRGQMKNRVKKWAILRVDDEISNYYRWWINHLFHTHLLQPAWNAHISVIRGEKDFAYSKADINSPLWKKYQGKIIEFEYSHEPYSCQNGNFWVIKARSEELTFIRQELGLVTKYGDTFHITVGKDRYKDLKDI